MGLQNIFSLVLMSFGVLSIYAQKVPNLPWCSSCNDPHMRSFDQNAYEFQISGTNFILYTNYLDTRVTASFKRCNPNRETPVCNCGVHVKHQGVILFLDTCGSLPKHGLSFNYAKGPQWIPKPALCDQKTIPPGREVDDAWWKTDGNAVNVEGKLLCAKSQNQADVYYIRTNNEDNNANIYVKVQLHCRGISCIFVRPARNDYAGKVGGLCGNFNGNKTDDLVIWDCTGTPDGTVNGGYSVVPADAKKMSKFWRLDGCAPDELHYKQLDRDICLCDKTRPVGTECSVPLALCVANTQRHPHVPQIFIHNHDAFECDRPTAIAACFPFFDLFKLIEAVLANLLEQILCDLLKEWCILDFMATQDHFWTINTCQIGRNWALETCGDSNKHSLCSEFKVPCRCLIPDYRSLLNDKERLDSCPRKETCPLPTCP